MNNPPAFPLTSNWHNELKHYNGMGLRDYFAAKAMQALISSPRMPAPAALGGSDVTDVIVADLSYKMADAMLKEREK